MSNQVIARVNGKDFEGFTAVTVEKSMEQLVGTFSLNITQKQDLDGNGNPININVPIKTQDEIQILIAEELVMTAVVESLSLEYDSESHSINVSGREKTKNLIDSSIVDKDYEGNITLVALIKMVLSDNGFTDIDVGKDRGLTDTLLIKDTKIKTKTGETIFQFIDRYAKKVQVMLLTTGRGDILLTRESIETIETRLIRQFTGQKNNVLSNNNILQASLNLSTADRFNEIEVRSQTDNNAFTINASNQMAIENDSEITENRRLLISVKETSDEAILKEIAKWNINIRRARGRSYNCKIADFVTDTGLELWKFNRLVVIKDDFADMDGEFLIKGVIYEQTPNKGSITSLSIVEKGSFAPDIRSTLKKKTNNFAGLFEQ